MPHSTKKPLWDEESPGHPHQDDGAASASPRWREHESPRGPKGPRRNGGAKGRPNHGRGPGSRLGRSQDSPLERRRGAGNFVPQLDAASGNSVPQANAASGNSVPQTQAASSRSQPQGASRELTTRLLVSVLIGTTLTVLVGLGLSLAGVATNVVLGVVAPIFVGSITLTYTILGEQKRAQTGGSGGRSSFWGRPRWKA